MPARSESKQIGQHTYKVTQLGFGKGRAMLVKLAKVAGPVVGKLVEAVKSGDTKVALKSLDPAALGSVFEEIAVRVDEATLAEFCAVFGDTTQVTMPDGKTPFLTTALQETHFAGAYLEMFQWLAFALEVNYRDFFGGLLGRNDDASAPAPANA